MANVLRLVRPTTPTPIREDVKADARELADLMQRIVLTHPEEVASTLRYLRLVAREPPERKHA